MSLRDDVVRIARGEAAKPVAWSTDENRILEYFAASTGQVWDKKRALTISWCSYFVHWVLLQAKVNPTPKVGTGTSLGKLGSIGRFMKSFGGVYADRSVQLHDYRPIPGDMFYLPVPHDHIGIIVDVQDLKGGQYQIDTINGNSGPDGPSPLFDSSPLIGKNFVFRRSRQLPGNSWYIKLPTP